MEVIMTTTTEFQKENLIDLLSKNVCEVVFTKVDGSERKMLCTLIADKLPVQEEKEVKKTPNPNVVPAYDLEKNAWRAFRLDSIKSFNVV